MKKSKKTTVVINDDFFVEIDEYNYTLFKKSKVEDDKGNVKESSRVLGYYPNMKLALKRARREKLSNLTSTLSLDEYLAVLEDLEESIK